MGKQLLRQKEDEKQCVSSILRRVLTDRRAARLTRRAALPTSLAGPLRPGRAVGSPRGVANC